MVDSLAVRFLSPGPDNDIYDWLTAAFGAPWGPHNNPGLIPAESADEIHFLLYDIDGAGGYFSTSSSYLRNPASNIAVRHSSERLLFTIDAPSAARIWESGDGRTAGTLAHEFQHMIHFYQKRVRHGGTSEAWLNEMASEVAEDLVADKIMVAGPRGVDPDDPTAGEPENNRGRLPKYNYYNYFQATKWEYDPPLYRYYSINYALGAYLARAYGGVPLFGAIVRNGSSGIDAIEAGLAELGHSVSFEDVLTNWAVANLLSDDTRAESQYRYNSGTWSESESGGVTFRLGSINLFNYRYDDDEEGITYDGPYFSSVAEFNEGAQLPHSNRYTYLGRNTDTVRLRIDADEGTRITLVVKE